MKNDTVRKLKAMKLPAFALADSILDRIIPSAYTLKIDGNISMRQRKRIISDQ